MCLIIATELGKLPEREQVKNAFENNPDGWGIVIQRSNAQLDVRKGYQLETLYNALDCAKGRPYICHLRFATHGSKSVDNLHPFRVTKTLYVAHNGILQVPIERKEKSDTWHFVERELKPILRAKPDLLQKDSYVDGLGRSIGNSNKLAFIDEYGRITIVNDKEGIWEGSIWYSNAHSLEDPFIDYGISYQCGVDDQVYLQRFLNARAYDYDDAVECDYCSEKTLRLYETPDAYEICTDCYVHDLTYYARNAKQ